MNPENLLGQWCRLLFESLADAGLSDVVVSPGSRSTPLVTSVLACKRLRPVSMIDERAAAFYAVGHARITGRAVALVCTSGSAVANYFPAVVEAALSRTPLLVISADRPFELHDCGASQTIDQTRIFGAYAKFVDLGTPDGSSAALSALRRRAAQAMLDTRFPEPGVVHYDVRAQKPLEPVQGTSREALALTSKVDALLGTPITRTPRPDRVPQESTLEALSTALASAVRGLIVCGPAPAHDRDTRLSVARLAAATGFPVYGDPTSQLRFDAPGDLGRELTADGLPVLASAGLFSRLGVPDVVLQIGAPPVSSAWEQLLAAHPGMDRHVLCAHGYPDPDSSARSVILGDPGRSVDLLAALEEKRAPAEARRRWARDLAAANEVVERARAANVASAPFPSEGLVTRTICEALPPGSILALGNSLPVRHADAFGSSRTDTGIWVLSQRGTAGIDGVVASAAGAADASCRPTVLVVGDVSALHDVGGFAAAARTRAPFVVVVLNNDGGRIFEQLPLLEAGLDDAALAFWTTPHGRTFDPVARLHGLAYARPETAADLRSAVLAGLARTGSTLIEVICPPHGARQEYRELHGRVAAALASLPLSVKATP